MTSTRAGFELSASGGELALVAGKGGADVGGTSAFLLPMIGTMTIITTFISPYAIKFGWKFAQRWKPRIDDSSDGSPTSPTKTEKP